MKDPVKANSKKNAKNKDLIPQILESLLKYDILTKTELILALKLEPSRSRYYNINGPLEELQKNNIIEITERSKKKDYLVLMEKRKRNPDKYGPLLKILNKSPSKEKTPNEEQKEETRGGGSQIYCKIVKSIDTIQFIHGMYPKDIQLQECLRNGDWVQEIILSKKFTYISDILRPRVKEALYKIPSFFSYAINLPHPEDEKLEFLSMITEESPNMTDFSKERLKIGDIVGVRQLYSLLSVLGYMDIKGGVVTKEDLLEVLKPFQKYIHAESVFSKEYDEMKIAMVCITNLNHLAHRGKFLFAVPEDFTYIQWIIPFLNEKADPVSQYLIGRFSPDTLELFKDLNPKKVIKKNLIDAVTRDINAVLEDPGLVYDLINIPHKPQILTQIGHLTSINDIVHRNRLIIEYGYEHYRSVPSAQSNVRDNLTETEKLIFEDNQLRINYQRSNDEKTKRKIMEDRITQFNVLRKLLTKDWV